MKLENGTPWKSASMGRTLPIVLILIGYGENDLRKSRVICILIIIKNMLKYNQNKKRRFLLWE